MLRRLVELFPPVRRLYERVDRLVGEVDELNRDLAERKKTEDELAAMVEAQQPLMIERARIAAEIAADEVLRRAGISLGIDAELYLQLENRFRGEAASIEGRLEAYLPFVMPLSSGPYPLVDLGAGRGEWLRMMMDRGIACHGVDESAAMVDEARRAGVDVRRSDLLAYLRAAPSKTIGALTLFHVVEHLPFSTMAELFHEAERVLAPGGVLLLETPNAANVGVAATTFWVDPTHQRPVYPPLLEFLADQSGFSRVQFLQLHRALDQPKLADASIELQEAVATIWEVLFGPQDLGFAAWTANDEP